MLQLIEKVDSIMMRRAITDLDPFLQPAILSIPCWMSPDQQFQLKLKYAERLQKDARQRKSQIA